MTNAGGVVIRGLRKRFGDTVALDGLDLQATPGEILGVAGPNGAGKSTMVRILAGEESPDSGDIEIGGSSWSHALDGHRVAVVHQEPQLFPNLTVAENIQVGRESMRRGRPRATGEEVALMQQLDIAGVSGVQLELLPLAVHQKTEIARALSRRADVFLFDEPNSALTEDESEELFEWMHSLARAGSVVILVSHRLGEMAAHCGRVCVLRDGKVAAELSGDTLRAEQIARELVVGVRQTAGDPSRRVAARENRPLLATHRWTHRGGRFHDIDFTAAAGEIVAVVGVEGAGGRELVQSLAGLQRADGTISVRGKHSGRAATSHVEFVGADRHDSLFTNLTVEENLVVRQYAGIAGRGGWLRRKAARQLAQEARAKFVVKTQDIDSPIRSLSGGNQQKVAIAAALAIDPTIVVLEEPTRGVDVGSKAEIYGLLRDFSKRDRAVVLYCTEFSEVFDVADRAVIVSSGHILDTVDVWRFADAESLAEHVTALTVRERERSPAIRDDGQNLSRVTDTKGQT